MNINVRIRQYRNRQKPAIPAWPELQSMDEAEVKALAAKLNIEFTDRMGTLSRIHKSRG